MLIITSVCQISNNIRAQSPARQVSKLMGEVEIVCHLSCLASGIFKFKLEQSFTWLRRRFHVWEVDLPTSVCDLGISRIKECYNWLFALQIRLFKSSVFIPQSA